MSEMGLEPRSVWALDKHGIHLLKFDLLQQVAGALLKWISFAKLLDNITGKALLMG